MSFICPVCNGLRALQAFCPRCAASMSDGGRVDDYNGPYSPYRPIDDMKMTNGFTDLSTHRCVHFMHCPACGCSCPRQVQEWHA